MQQKIRSLMGHATQARIFPGGVVGYSIGGRRACLPFGRHTYEPNAPIVAADTIYDVASVTKIIPVNSIALALIERGLLALNDPLIQFVPELQNQDCEKILIKHLLTYTVVFDLPQKSLIRTQRRSGQELLHELFTAPLQVPPGTSYRYTSAPSILLGVALERIMKQPLDAIADDLFFVPLRMRHTTFHPDTLPQDHIAPTEINWRGTVRGAVHDESAWMMQAAGMIPGHAGVFSNASDLITFGEMLLNRGEYDGRRYLKAETVAQMHTNQIADIGASAGLGWDIHQPYCMGDHASAACFGKTGFTGSMVLIDPAKQTVLVLLTNRTYPKRPPDSAAINTVRRSLSDIVFGQHN